MKAIPESDLANLMQEWRTRANVAPPESASAFRICADAVERLLIDAAPIEAERPAPAAPVEATVPGVFVNRESGAVMRVVEVNDSYAHIAALDGSSKYAMPRAEYDSLFAKWFRPAVMSDLGPMTDLSKYAPPAEQADDWGERPTIGSEF